MFREITEPKVSHLKAGFYGQDGSGKTRTATELAIGLHRHIKSQKGILFIDTENGSDFVAPRVRAAGIRVYQDKTRAFSELLHDLEQASTVADIVIVDSVTHFWRELLAAYMESRRKAYIDLSDWDPIKREWRRFTDLFLTMPAHVILCGRLGNVWEDIYDESKEKFTAAKTGNRMAGEGETGYEPHLVVELSKQFRRKGGAFDIRALVTKDRWDAINGRLFTFETGDHKPQRGKPVVLDPTTAVWQAFEPHLRNYAFGQEASTVDTEATSVAMFAPAGPSYASQQRARTVETEEIRGVFARTLPGQTSKEKQLRTEILIAVFGTSSETRIEGFAPDRLREGRRRVEYLADRLIRDGIPEARQFAPIFSAWLGELVEVEPSASPEPPAPVRTAAVLIEDEYDYAAAV